MISNIYNSDNLIIIQVMESIKKIIYNFEMEVQVLNGIPYIFRKYHNLSYFYKLQKP